MTTGILFALLAMLFFGFGDFLIQRSTRKVGDWETLFLFSILGGVQLFGVIGLIAGPVVVSAFLALLRVYPFILHQDLSTKT
jgi:hypothetical protein